MPGAKLAARVMMSGHPMKPIRKNASPAAITRPHGYSGTPLAAKLGFKPGLRIAAIDAPAGYLDLLAPLPDGVAIVRRVAKDLDGVHVFTSERSELARALPLLAKSIKPDGFIWVSWPKKASGVPTDVGENTIRELAFPLGLVDVKVCAVDATWSGLKLVIRKALRKG